MESSSKATPDMNASSQLSPRPAQLCRIENELLDAANDLKNRRRVIGTLLTLEEMLNPVEEQEIGQSAYTFEGGDEEIVSTVQHELDIQSGKVIEISDDKEDDDKEEEAELNAFSTKDIVQFCQKLERLCFRHGYEDSLAFSGQLRRFRTHLVKQVT
ncbi:hypothetical protein D9613_008851 [Agrocybe pediades]|uniref:Uncharacterized protein n=1 Tax=Agrocybe pediades TaxID=84607 RepID=A0A8H4VQV4_9AGAR|nr:hypothetical protein D9613_008851 [Agrocybe pediades]